MITCPNCGCTNSTVIRTRQLDGTVLRKRRCFKCGRDIDTEEKAIEARPDPMPAPKKKKAPKKKESAQVVTPAPTPEPTPEPKPAPPSAAPRKAKKMPRKPPPQPQSTPISAGGALAKAMAGLDD